MNNELFKHFPFCRLIEPEGGCVCIDGRNIATMHLHELRSSLTVIPQESLLFAGTLRNNLDPFNEFPDDLLIQSLKKCYLNDLLTEYGLDKPLEESQLLTISLGQAQLLCLARALLKMTKVLILDEATAAMDPATDELIQCTIQEEFSNCTVLTIVHRLNTVLNYDRILVLHHGAVVEYDTPQNLVANKESMFYAMLKSDF